MNEELQGALAELLNKTLNGVDTASEFLTAEIPDVINQLLLWYGVHSMAMCIGAMLLAWLFVFLDIKAYGVMKKRADEDKYADFAFEYLFIGSLPRIAWIFPIGMFNLTWIKIWIAPKIWLMEYASTIVK